MRQSCQHDSKYAQHISNSICMCQEVTLAHIQSNAHVNITKPVLLKFSKMDLPPPPKPN